MDQRLQQALEFSNYRLTLNSQLQKLKLKTENLLIFAKNGGTFNVDQILICFLSFLKNSGQSSANLLDNKNNPIHIEDVEEFLENITTRYFEVTNDYLREYQKIKKARNVKSLIDLQESE